MKKILIVIIGIVLFIFILITAYYIKKDMGEEGKLKREINDLHDLLTYDITDYDKINEKLNTIVTTGDYAKVEKASKNYFSDIFINSFLIMQIINDDKIIQILSIDNYKDDGPTFTKTKQYITTNKNNLESYKVKHYKFFTKEKVMSYLDKKNLDSYYVNLYRKKIIGDIESERKNNSVEKSIDDIINVLNNSEKVINLLIQNKNLWTIKNNNIYFYSQDLEDNYNKLIKKVKLN